LEVGGTAGLETCATQDRNLLALTFFNIQGTILPEQAKTKKPTVGFSARIFLRAPIERKILKDSDLQTQKTTKTCKSAK
jgi:hypothetical protein